MASFKFPRGLCEELDAIVRKFWWSLKSNSNRFYTPLAWSKLCKPHSLGVLGFREFERFNEAMLAKLTWWVLSNWDSLCVNVLRAKYRVGNQWLQSNAAKSASFTWRGLEGVCSLLSQGSCMLVGSGEQILVWNDPWIPNLPHCKPQSCIPMDIPHLIAVNSLMTLDKSGWDLSKLQSLFDDATIQAILNIPKWNTTQSDQWI
jgi:hypothetical protein